MTLLQAPNCLHSLTLTLIQIYQIFKYFKGEFSLSSRNTSEFRQYFQKRKFRKNSDILPKILFTKNEVRQSQPLHFETKIIKFRQKWTVFWLNFQQLFSC